MTGENYFAQIKGSSNHESSPKDSFNSSSIVTSTSSSVHPIECQFPCRPGLGKAGQPIILKTNFFDVIQIYCSCYNRRFICSFY